MNNEKGDSMSQKNQNTGGKEKVKESSGNKKKDMAISIGSLKEKMKDPNIDLTELEKI